MRIVLFIICCLLSLRVSAQIDSVRYIGYNNTIQRADTAFARGQYEQPRSGYEQAMVMRYGDQYASKRMKECDLLIHEADMRSPDQNYTRYLSWADSCFGQADFARAKLYYRRASNLRPMEQYPKDKLRQIDGMMICGNRFFPQAIMAGDSLFLAGDYAGAKARYQEAAAIMPAETYPREQITRCERELQYSTLILAADSLFDLKDYKDALVKYKEASVCKPAELYPRLQIKHCNANLKEDH